MSRLTPTLLLLLDGWGAGEPGPGNALSLAETPHLDTLLKTWPHCTLACTGEAVGLPAGQMGNSEVGHLNIGAGRVVYQDIVRIDKAIQDRSFFTSDVLTGLLSAVKAAGGRLHLMGLVSDGGVHSHQRHLHALLELTAAAGVDPLVHCFLDGRDTPPRSGQGYVRQLLRTMERLGSGRVASVTGRYWAMDRDKRWDRVARAYQALVQGRGAAATDPLEAIAGCYERGETDEFVPPQVMVDQSGRPLGRMQDGDGIFFFNFRADRARELVYSLWREDFDAFERAEVPDLSGMATMTVYDADLDLPAVFPPQRMDDILAQVVSGRGLRQLRIAETEKYAHVTYFFNGGVERAYPGEDRVLIPSPHVATYDLKPEMSVLEVSERLCKELAGGAYDLVVCNFANLDMVGHTGVMEAAVRACEVVDDCVGRVVKTVLDTNGRLLLSADHGNADTMLDAVGGVHTAHSMNPVPFVWVEEGNGGRRLRPEGILGDVAPTVLDLWGLPQPEAMTGKSLLHGRSRE